MMSEIRDAVPGDLPMVTEIYNYYIQNSTATFCEQTYTLADITEKFSHIQQLHLPYVVAVEQKQVVGFAYLSTFRTQSAYRIFETTIFLRPHQTGKHLGKALYDRLLAQAKTASEITGVVAVVTTDNLPSNQFHQKYGFRHVGHFERAGLKFGELHGIEMWQLTF